MRCPYPPTWIRLPPLVPLPHCACACPLDPRRPGPSPACPRVATCLVDVVADARGECDLVLPAGRVWVWASGRQASIHGGKHVMRNMAGRPAPCLARGRAARRRSRPDWCVPDESIFPLRPLLQCHRCMHARSTGRWHQMMCIYMHVCTHIRSIARRCLSARRAPASLLSSTDRATLKQWRNLLPRP